MHFASEMYGVPYIRSQALSAGSGFIGWRSVGRRCSQVLLGIALSGPEQRKQCGQRGQRQAGAEVSVMTGCPGTPALAALYCFI